MKIVDFKSYQKAVNKLDQMANTDMTKLNTVFPQDESIADRMKKFFDIADGNPEWRV